MIWSLKEIGTKYNDIFSSNLMNSHQKRSFYCCQLISEAYKCSNTKSPGESPFLPYKLNFADSSGKIIPYWIKYFKQRCPSNPIVPQGESGTHPSILRMSPCIKLLGSRIILKKQKIKTNEFIYKKSLIVEENMRRFVIPNDLVRSLHFINGTRVNIESSSKFNVFEPRNGKI